jgi:hypothetical protein
MAACPVRSNSTALFREAAMKRFTRAAVESSFGDTKGNGDGTTGGEACGAAEGAKQLAVWTEATGATSAKILVAVILSFGGDGSC